MKYNTKAGESSDATCPRCKLMYSLQAAVLFFIIANPETYKLTGGNVLLHSLVYGLVVYLLMLKF